ncbi:hypothetical protein GIB67_035417 [Kingdonia uniflora]|uniref:Peptidase C1A papain C-terminal domain-containing protein n=1 Tax=Kingdonia uniflora TaxID=39325 RepID=A0A7J7P0J3_9MAGN|nr:hypothetical protein GIB67_035417 [Kingdonia uniflora]
MPFPKDLLTSFKYENVTAVPSSLDWRKKGVVTPIKDQGQCGKIVLGVFSRRGNQGITQFTTGKLISLSEQELVDYDTSGVDQADGTCDAKKASSPAAKITGYEIVPANSEKALLKAVANQPIVVSIDVAGSAFQFYSSGVFNGECIRN